MSSTVRAESEGDRLMEKSEEIDYTIWFESFVSHLRATWSQYHLLLRLDETDKEVYMDYGGEG
jgi:hypothetical protein